MAELSSSSYHDVSKRAYKEYPRELIDVITSIRGDNLSMVIVVSHKNSVIVASIPTISCTENHGDEWTYLYCLQTFNAEVQFLRALLVTYHQIVLAVGSRRNVHIKRFSLTSRKSAGDQAQWQNALR